MNWTVWGGESEERQRRERQMERTKAGRDGDNSVRVYRVYVLNTLQEAEHTLRYVMTQRADEQRTDPA